MKFLVAFALAVAVVHADVSHVVGRSADVEATVLRSEGEVKPDGFQYAYETSNGIAASANGVVKDFNSDHATQSVSGEFRYVSPEGTPYSVSYVADENGFQPKGDHLPVAPEVPVLIARSLEYIAAHPQVEDKFARVAQPVQQAYKPVQAAQPVQQAYKPAQAAYKKPYSF